MGTKELLLLVLGAIIVGAAIVFGINQFHNHGVQSHQSALILQMNTLWGDLLAYKNKPVVLGGGGGSFDGFQPINAGPFKTSKAAKGGARFETEEAVYYVEYFTKDRIRIIASSKIYGNGARTGNVGSSRIVAVFNKNQKLNNKGFRIVGVW